MRLQGAKLCLGQLAVEEYRLRLLEAVVLDLTSAVRKRIDDDAKRVLADERKRAAVVARLDAYLAAAGAQS